MENNSLIGRSISSSIQLPLDALVDIYADKSVSGSTSGASFIRSFTIIYLKIGFERMDETTKAALSRRPRRDRKRLKEKPPFVGSEDGSQFRLGARHTFVLKRLIFSWGLSLNWNGSYPCRNGIINTLQNVYRRRSSLFFVSPSCPLKSQVARAIGTIAHKLPP